jgi:transcriptional regulator with XRE-family HTH domain
MAEPGTIGRQIRVFRHERGLTQEQLAERAQVSVDLVKKLEQGARQDARATYLMRLARALDIDLSELTGRRPRISVRDGASVQAIRDVLLCPSLLPGFEADDDGEPASAEEMSRAVARAWELYWSGDFAELTRRLPGLVAEARVTGVAGLLAQAYQLAACLMVHFGRDDLAVLGAERAVTAAAEGEDELLWATLNGTYAWAMLHQGRAREAETHAMRVAERIEPTFTSPPAHLVVWGGLLLTALAAAAAESRKASAEELISLSRAAATRFTGGDRHDYQVPFGPTQVAMQATHAYTMLREPGEALRSAAGVRREDLRTIAYGRHLVDKAQAQVDAGYDRAAERTLTEAHELSAVWFRHQGPARSLVARLREQQTRLTPGLRQLARSIDAR